MAPIVASVDIERSPEDVFSYITDLPRQVEWQESLVSASTVTDEPTRVGTRIIHRRKVGPRVMVLTSEVTVHDPPHMFAFRSVDGPIRAQGSGRVEPTQTGSRVTVELELSGRGFGKLMLPIVRRQASRQLVSDHQKLKQIMEAGGHEVHAASEATSAPPM